MPSAFLRNRRFPKNTAGFFDWITMFDSILTKIFGSRNDRLIRQYRKKCAAINKLGPEMEKLTDDELKHKTVEFRERLAKGEDLQALLPEAFAVVIWIKTSRFWS